MFFQKEGIKEGWHLYKLKFVLFIGKVFFQRVRSENNFLELNECMELVTNKTLELNPWIDLGKSSMEINFLVANGALDSVEVALTNK